MSFETTRQNRDFLQDELSTLACADKVFNSEGNFILLRLKDYVRSEDFCRNMLERYSIYLKDVSKKFSDGHGYIRFAVRRPAENKMLIEKIKSQFDKKAV